MHVKIYAFGAKYVLLESGLKSFGREARGGAGEGNITPHSNR
jgi:hypothetical protein